MKPLRVAQSMNSYLAMKPNGSYIFKAKGHRPPSTPSNHETSRAPETTFVFSVVVTLY